MMRWIYLSVALVIAMTACGKGGRGRAKKDAIPALEAVEKANQALTATQTHFLAARNEGYKPTGVLEQQLKDTEIPVPDSATLMLVVVHRPRPSLAEDLAGFYQSVAELEKDLRRHTDTWKRNRLAFAAAAKRRALPGGEDEATRYGVILIAPDADLKGPSYVASKLAELGANVCVTKSKAQVEPCDGPPIGFRYRFDPNGPWRIATVAADPIEPNKVLPLAPTPVFLDLAKGSKHSAAETLYMHRLADLAKRTERLLHEGKDLAKKLEVLAGRGDG